MVPGSDPPWPASSTTTPLTGVSRSGSGERGSIVRMRVSSGAGGGAPTLRRIDRRRERTAETASAGTYTVSSAAMTLWREQTCLPLT